MRTKSYTSLRVVVVVGGLAGAFSGLLGCAHKTRIVTNPPGAKVYVRDQMVCTTPCTYETPATRLERHTPLRIERRGYATVNSELRTGIMAKRVVAGVFTLGIVPLFRWPHTYYDRHSFDLQELSYEERLADLEAKRSAGQITDQEYELLRRHLLGMP